jgi:hypothetical protein
MLLIWALCKAGIMKPPAAPHTKETRTMFGMLLCEINTNEEGHYPLLIPDLWEDEEKQRECKRHTIPLVQWPNLEVALQRWKERWRGPKGQLRQCLGNNMRGIAVRARTPICEEKGNIGQHKPGREENGKRHVELEHHSV